MRTPSSFGLRSLQILNYWLQLVCLGSMFGLPGPSLFGQEIKNAVVTITATKAEADISGFDVRAEGRTVALVRFSSTSVGLVAGQAQVNARADTLTFKQLKARGDCGLRFSPDDSLAVHLKAGDPYPVVRFDLTLASFDPAAWKKALGAEPFHFLALYLAEATAWHQRGWLNATPLADPFPLLLDRHVGTPEISAYHYNRNWSYTPPLGAHPLPVIGLWAPSVSRYVGLEFQTTRLQDNSEKDLATGYRWVDKPDPAKADSGQFVALVYPYGGQGYQQLVFPTPGSRLHSQGTLLWSLHLPATDDPNRLLWSFLWPRVRDRLPPVPSVPNLAWIPGGIHLSDFFGPAGGRLIGGVEKPFQVPDSKLIYGWTWHNESPTAGAARRGDVRHRQALEAEARELLPLAKRFQADGDECLFWEKPLSGEWTPEWGGKPATTLHNANGFAAGRLFLGLFRDFCHKEYLPVVEGVFNWAKHMAWTRNEFADVPSSPFAIGGTLTASFCLEYYETFKHSTDSHQRERAQLALELARAFTYRYLVMWPSDNNRDDNLDSSFLWEPNSGRDWTGAACANEVFWNLDTLAQTAVHTGDPVLLWALQGSLDRWHLLYQNVWKGRLANYQASDMAEGYGLYAGNVYGVGARAGYGFAAPLIMTEPIGRSAVRVLAGEKAALAFRKNQESIEIADYRYADSGNLAFTIRSARTNFDLSLTVPYIDLSDKPVAVLRDGHSLELKQGINFLRPPLALWSLYLRNLEPNDRVIIGHIDDTGPLLPTAPPRSQSAFSRKPPPAARPPFESDGYTIVPLPCDSTPDLNWQDLGACVGVPRGRFWAFGVPFELAALADRCAVTNTVRFAEPIGGCAWVYLLYDSRGGSAPSLVYADGQKAEGAAAKEALAWRAWPPIYTTGLLMARIPARTDAKVAGLEPGGHAVWAMTAQPRSAPQTEAQQGAFAAFEKGVVEWKRTSVEEERIGRLQRASATIQEGRIAILPPQPGGEAFSFGQRAGVLKRAVTVSARQLVDPSFFNPGRFRVALYLAGEDYVQTVHTAGDGAAALVGYVRGGGTLVLLASQPFPLYYATGQGAKRAEPLTDLLGLPLGMAIESLPPEKLQVQIISNPAWPGLAETEFPYPSIDPRLRSINRNNLPSGAKYSPMATVKSATGKDYGDAAGLVELPGGGSILYVASILQRDPEHGFAFLEAAYQFVLEAATRP